MAYYYPEGYFGPVCDALVSDDEIANKGRRAITIIEEDQEVVVIPGAPDGFFETAEGVLGTSISVPNYVCKVDSDGNYYDCRIDTDAEQLPEILGLLKDYGLKDNLFVPTINAQSCSPFDSDINIRPESYYDASGTLVTKYKRQRSNPVTYNVTSKETLLPGNSTLSITFASNGDLVATGTGSANVNLVLEWDDDPNNAGTALGSIEIEGTTWTQSGEEGSQEKTINLSGPGTYSTTITGNPNGFTRQNADTELCFFDANGSDCNATFRVTSTYSPTTVSSGYWSDEGNSYAVWTNPEVCTLPDIPQQVTYQIPIPATDTYGFTFACDDNAQLYIGDTNTPFMNISGGIFASGALSTPYTSTTTINQGTLHLTVRCTNSDAGFQDGNGNPTGLAYDWNRNPGGWYIKICRGGVCPGENIINWVTAGSHPNWSTFMNTYAVFPSNTDSLEGVAQTATWSVDIPSFGNYTLEAQADNTATFTFDGNSVGTVSSFTTSTTFTTNLTNISAGNYSLAVSVTNSVETINNWSNNPGGVAFVLRDSSNNVIITSLALTQPANGNLIWHTRLATGYETYTI